MNPSQAATAVRKRVVAVTSLMAVLLYLDRLCLSLAEVYIKQDLGLTDTQISYLLGTAFFLPYALAQVPSGWLSDRFGPRTMLTLYILTWSVFTGLLGLGTAFWALVLMRVGVGLGQAGGYPTSANLISKWMPFTSRGTASSLIAVGGRVGGALAPLLTAYLIVSFVPIDTPSTLSEGDLLNLPRFAWRMQHADPAPANEAHRDSRSAAGLSPAQALGNEMLPLLSVDVRTTLDRAANAETRWRQQVQQATDPNEVPGRASFDLSPAKAKPLLEELNALLLLEDLFPADRLAELSLPDEAERLLADAKHPPPELKDEEQLRLNRLLLEAAFPNSIRKVYVSGWRPVMWTYGLAGVAVALIFWLIIRDLPRRHPGCNEAEIALIEHGRPKSAPKPDGKVSGVPIMRMLKSGSLWLICISQWFTNVGWVFLVTWLPRYLLDEHGVPIEQRGLMTLVPIVVGWFGMIYGGRLTDKLVSRFGLRLGRALPLSLSRFAAMGAYLACLFSPSPWQAVALFSIVAFSTDLGAGATWAFKQDVGGRYVGSILGWGNMWGNLGAAVTPTLLIWVVGDEQNWNAAFLLCAGAFFLSGLAAAGVNAAVPIAPPDEDDAASD